MFLWCSNESLYECLNPLTRIVAGYAVRIAGIGRRLVSQQETRAKPVTGRTLRARHSRAMAQLGVLVDFIRFRLIFVTTANSVDYRRNMIVTADHGDSTAIRIMSLSHEVRRLRMQDKMSPA